MIYTQHEIDNNPLYGNLMRCINDLYEEYGRPRELADARWRTTCGQYVNPPWESDAIGDWGGDEERIADQANTWWEQFARPLGLHGIRHAYTTREWEAFIEKAIELYEEDRDEAFNRLCNDKRVGEALK